MCRDGYLIDLHSWANQGYRRIMLDDLDAPAARAGIMLASEALPVVNAGDKPKAVIWGDLPFFSSRAPIFREFRPPARELLAMMRASSRDDPQSPLFSCLSRASGALNPRVPPPGAALTAKSG
jgi:hypothetical protein